MTVRGLNTNWPRRVKGVEQKPEQKTVEGPAQPSVPALGVDPTDVGPILLGPGMNNGTESRNVTIPVSGFYTLRAWGPGGGGACAKAATTGDAVTASGGAAGGFCKKTVWINAGTVLAIVVGQGGPEGFKAGTTVGQDGNDGMGPTTITGTNIAMTANPGTGGVAHWTGGSTATSSGGTASGGDVNLTGGNGGAAGNTGQSGPGGSGGPGGDGDSGNSSTQKAGGGGGAPSDLGFFRGQGGDGQFLTTSLLDTDNTRLLEGYAPGGGGGALAAVNSGGVAFRGGRGANGMVYIIYRGQEL